MDSIRRLQDLRKQNKKIPSLSLQQIKEFDELGYLINPSPGIDLEQIQLARKELEDLEIAKKGAGNAVGPLYLISERFYDLATHPNIISAVQDIIGPDVLLFNASFFIKEPGPSFVGWHIDSTYWGIAPHDLVTVWLALSDVTEASGPMELLKGTHLTDESEYQTEETYVADNILTRGQNMKFDSPIDYAKDVGKAILKPGQFSIHHHRIVHASSPNNSNDRRIGWTLRYVASHCGSIYPAGDSAMYISGKEYGNLRLDVPLHLGGTMEDITRNGKIKGSNTMFGADKEKFRKVLKERNVKNLPQHVIDSRSQVSAKL